MAEDPLKEAFSRIVLSQSPTKEISDAGLGLHSDRSPDSTDGFDRSRQGLVDLSKGLSLDFGRERSEQPPVEKKNILDLNFSRNSHVSKNTDLDEEDKPFLTYKQAPSFEQDVIAYIENQHLKTGEIPSYKELHETFEDYPERPRYIKQWADVLDRLSEKLDLRGLPTYRTAENYLEPQFISACNVILNQRDSRTDTAKLKDMGLTSAKWNKWLKSKKYWEYYQTLANKIFDEEVQVSAKRTVTKLVEQGDLSAVKYLNEWQGTYRPQDNTVMLMQTFMNAILSILARNVPSQTINIIQGELRNDPGIKQALGFIETQEAS